MRGKIADVLIELSERIYNSDYLKFPLTQEDLGNLVDSSRESISRVLTEFENDGIIRLPVKRLKSLKRNRCCLSVLTANRTLS